MKNIISVCHGENPSCCAIETEEGVKLTNHIFLMTQMPCCAQLALPYWAKITGKIDNMKDEEGFFAVTVTLYDEEGGKVGETTDIVVLDAAQEGQFELKITEHKDYTKTYAITAREVSADYIC